MSVFFDFFLNDEMISTVASRIEEFIKYNSISTRQFEDIVGLSNGSIFVALKTDEAFSRGEKDKPGGLSSHNLAKILIAFPELNAEWLVLGVGEMLKKQEQPPKSKVIDKKNEVNIIAEFKSIHEKLDAILRTINRP